MSDEIIRRNTLITTISLLIFCIFSFLIISYYNKKTLETQLINISAIVSENIKTTSTESELFSVIDEFTKNQEWLEIAVSNSYGYIIKDSANDAIGVSIDSYFDQNELSLLNDEIISRVYIRNNHINCIVKINENIIIRTSLIYQKNISYIYMGISIVLLLLLAVVFSSIFVSKKTSKEVIDTFENIGEHLKTINEGCYQEIDCNYKYPEVEKVLSEINAINNNIYFSMQRIKNEHDKVNFVINNMSQGLLIISEDEKILLINDFAKSVLSIKNEAINKKSYKEYIRLSDFISNIEIIEKNKDITFFDIKQDDKIYSCNVTYSKSNLFVVDKEIGIYVIVMIDVTEKRANDRLKAEFISNASHELKTPITSIRGFSELMLVDNMKYDEETKNYLTIIYNESIKMKKTIDELLYLSNLEYRRNVENIKEKVYFISVINDAISSFESLAKSKNIEIIKKVNEDDFIVEQPQLLNHLISNLISNAIKYNKINGKVVIEVNSTDEESILIVEDTGVGIEKENLGKIFERFYRVDESRNSGGTGIGLNIVKQICEIIKAEITVDSTIDEGTRFTIRFKKSKINKM